VARVIDTGGKAKLFNQLRPLFPKHIDTFVDLMCGGCNVGVNIKANKDIYNDSNSNLIGLFKILQDTDINTFIADLEKYIKEFNLSESDKNGYEFYHADSNDGLAEYNRQHYLNLRDNFNSLTTKNLEYYEKLYLLIVYAFNNQIRFNSKGEFNLPVGKRDFNNSIRNKLITFTNRIKEQNAMFLNLSFLDFNEELNKDDFVYIDPPYLITTASYNENSGWTPNDERNLLNYLADLNKKKIKFGLSNVLKHKGRENNILIDWISEHGFVVHHLNKNYNNSNYQSKNTDKETDEVLITNY